MRNPFSHNPEEMTFCKPKHPSFGMSKPDPIESLSSELQQSSKSTPRIVRTIQECGYDKENKLSTEPSVEKDNTSEQTQDALSQLKKGKVLHDKFAQEFEKEYLISGKIMSEWRDHYKLIMPPDFTPKVCQDIAIKLMELHQEASFMKAVCDARLRACRGASNIKYRKEFTELVSTYRAKGEKLPAKDTLAQLAEQAVGDIQDAVSHAEIELSFWKEILDDLANSRKLLENATINLASESKALYSERYIDALSRKG